ncbi:MAG: hypothetical protein ACTSVC_10670, partial [Promethearchaeota archaeon]
MANHNFNPQNNKKKRGKKKKKKGNSAWGNLSFFYNLAERIHYYRIYRIAKLGRFPFVALPSFLYSKFALAKNKRLYSRVQRSLEFLYLYRIRFLSGSNSLSLLSNFNEYQIGENHVKTQRILKNLIYTFKKHLKRYISLTLFNISKILFELLFVLPNLDIKDARTESPKERSLINPYSLHNITIQNHQILFDALKMGKGVILSVAHLENFFLGAPAIFSLVNEYNTKIMEDNLPNSGKSKRVKVVGIANLKHFPLYKGISLIGKNKDLILVNTDSFNKIKPKLIDFLKKNYIVVIMV